MERDKILFMMVQEIFWISTHTLTWSVTIPPRIASISFSDFNSHAHVERDLVKISPFLSILNFNSHAHVERDLTMIIAFETSSISTHTLTWSVT